MGVAPGQWPTAAGPHLRGPPTLIHAGYINAPICGTVEQDPAVFMRLPALRFQARAQPMCRSRSGFPLPTHWRAGYEGPIITPLAAMPVGCSGMAKCCFLSADK